MILTIKMSDAEESPALTNHTIQAWTKVQTDV